MTFCGSNNMKCITPIWSNPIGWTEWIAKTPLRVTIWLLVHIGFVSAGFLMIYKQVMCLASTGTDRELVPLAIMSGAFPIILIGVIFPALYLYAMYRLLKTIRKNNKDAEQAGPAYPPQGVGSADP